MAKIFTSMGAITAALQQEMNEALTEAVNESYTDLEANVQHFYDAPGNPTSNPNPPPGYDRTGQFEASPQLDTITYNGNRAIGQISINTGTQYDPAGRDTETIYGYAEDNELLGNGGFWKKTVEIDIDVNIDNAFGKRFRR